MSCCCHTDVEKWSFMVRKLTRESKRRQLTDAEVYLVGILNKMLTDEQFAKSHVSHSVAMLCSCCSDPMWNNSEGD